LERFLHDRPLRHIPMVPLRDRGRKFIRRNRRRLIVGCSAAAALSAASLFVVHSYHKAHTERLARQKSEVIVSQLQKSADKEADEALARQLKVPDDGRNFYRCFLMGRESFLARQYAVALRCFSRAIELNSSFAPNYYYRGRSFANLDKDGSALDDFCRAIELDPTDVYSYLARATFYATSEEHSNTEKALDDLKKTYALLPPQLADRTKGLHLDIARALSAISDRLADEQKREEVLLEAEDNLIRALELGLELPYLKEAKSRDRFHMLDAVFKRPRIQRLIAEKEKADVAKGRN
jgi:tetratricopeptide (TPR) repeat protein